MVEIPQTVCIKILNQRRTKKRKRTHTYTYLVEIYSITHREQLHSRYRRLLKRTKTSDCDEYFSLYTNSIFNRTNSFLSLVWGYK